MARPVWRTKNQTSRLQCLGVSPEQQPTTFGEAGVLIEQLEIARGLRKPPKSKSGKNKFQQAPEGSPFWWENLDPQAQLNGWLKEQMDQHGEAAFHLIPKDERERLGLTLA